MRSGTIHRRWRVGLTVPRFLSLLFAALAFAPALFVTPGEGTLYCGVTRGDVKAQLMQRLLQVNFSQPRDGLLR